MMLTLIDNASVSRGAVSELTLDWDGTQMEAYRLINVSELFLCAL